LGRMLAVAATGVLLLLPVRTTRDGTEPLRLVLVDVVDVVELVELVDPPEALRDGTIVVVVVAVVVASEGWDDRASTILAVWVEFLGGAKSASVSFPLAFEHSIEVREGT
jgi:hypothetical protein